MPVLFFLITLLWNIRRFPVQHHKKLGVNDYSFTHPACSYVADLLRQMQNCSFAIYNNKFILCSACDSLENRCKTTKSLIISYLLSNYCIHFKIMFPTVWNALRSFVFVSV